MRITKTVLFAAGVAVLPAMLGLAGTASAASIKEASTCPGAAAGLDNVGGPWYAYFDSAKTKVKADSRDHLRRAADTVKGRMAQTVCLQGMADKQGNAAYNRKLALERSHQVGQDLIALGVKPDVLLVVTGPQVGETLGGVSSEIDKQEQDRKVEIRIVK